MIHRDTAPGLYLGFAAVIAVLVMLTGVGLYQFSHLGSGMEQVVNENDRQVELMSTMLGAARERSMILQSMMVIDDPFKRDELRLELAPWAASYFTARNELLTFPLSADEREMLEEQHAISVTTGQLQNRIAELLLEERDDEAHQLFFYEALPGQNRAMGIMEAFIDLKLQQNKASLNRTGSALDDAHQLMLGFSILGVLLSIAIAVVVVQKNRGAVAALTDATESLEEEIFARAKIEQELRESELRERTIRENMLDGIVTIDERGIIGTCNAAAVEMFGYREEELLGRNVSLLMPEPHRSAHDGYLHNYMTSGNSSLIGHGRELEGQRKNGARFPVELAVSEVWLKDKRIFIGVIRDITVQKEVRQRLRGARRELERAVELRTAELQRVNQHLEREVMERRNAEERLTFLANYDSLTELPNRSMFSVQFNTAIKHAKRNQKKVALFFMDLDGFKQVNDTLGHDVGDQLLKLACLRMRSVVREEDVVARMGGDEFTLILGELAEEGHAAIVAENILRVMAEPFTLQGEECQVGVSIGISCYPRDAEDAESLLCQADDAMYWVKRSGKMGFRYYADGEPEMGVG